MQERPPLSPGDKVAFLCRTSSYPHAPADVELIETHFAWVFLAGPLVYKLKKPIRFQMIDFTSVHTRRVNCELEVALNRRLARAVYIGVVPLGRLGNGLTLESEGDAVADWLVKMHRLPRRRTLEALLQAGTLRPDELRGVVSKLAAFYRGASKAPWSGSAYVERLRQQAEHYGEALTAPELGLRNDWIEQIVSAQIDFIAAHARLLAERAASGRIVDAHGDLRPEHIFLVGDEPQIIDCLEFSTELRLLDTAEEISFLDLELARLGRLDICDRLRDLYMELCEDPLSPALYLHYRSQRALARAFVSAWHLRDDLAPEQAAHWLNRAHWYLEAALDAVDRARALTGR